MSIDLDKMPLGSISDRQAQKGYATLREIADALKTPLPDVGAHEQRLLALTNAFYNTIPHTFARKQTPPIITSHAMLVQKIEAMEALLQVSQAQSLAHALHDEAGTAAAAPVHPSDANLAKLHCQLTPATAEEVAMVTEYAANTHGATHNQYRLKVRSVLRTEREGEQAGFKAAVGNRKLLWHGSRLTNWVGILSQGLRIAPPEAPVTGYMFGKGVYFADMVSKSANYCAGTRESPTAVLLLCDVALGAQHELVGSQFEAAERSKAAGKHSTWGIGKTCPDPAAARTTAEGASVPMGKGVPNSYLEEHLAALQAAGAAKRSELLYNEFIVYDTSQIRMRYVVLFDMDFDVEL